jgi:hypothetical protein
MHDARSTPASPARAGADRAEHCLLDASDKGDRHAIAQTSVQA